MKSGLAFVLVICTFPFSQLRGQSSTARKNNQAIIADLKHLDGDIDGFKQRQFISYDPNYEPRRTSRNAQVEELSKEVFLREVNGQDVQCARAILRELHWLIDATADFARVDQRSEELTSVLASPTNRVPGSSCLTLWFYQLDSAYDQLQGDKHFQFPTVLLDRINSPEKLKSYFMSVSVSDIAQEGVDHQEELNEPLADLTRLILRDRAPNNYAFDSGLKGSLLELVLHRLRDSTTGYWGERYVVDGRVQFIPDLSTTFHVINYLQGNVPEMGKVIDTTLAVKDRDSPVGWTYQGQQYNHNAMDVVTLFKWGWPHASPEQRREIAAEIQKMIDRCLRESLQADGSFKPLSAASSLEETTYFGVAFLSDAGFFDKSKRFWTDRTFPNAELIRQRLIAFIEKHKSSGGVGGTYYDSALESLGGHSSVRSER
jgi:hypothetical protein